MADFFTDASIMALLKTVYKEGIESDLYRNSPVLPMISKEKIDGKSYNWAAVFAASPTASFDYEVSADMAAKAGQNAEWSITKARQFATLSITQKEIKASRTGKGAYGRILGNKVFTALEGMRKQMAKVLYGRGYGEIGTYTGADVTPAANAVITLPEHITIAMVPGTQFRLMKAGVPTNVIPAVGTTPYIVGTVDDTQITLDATTSTTGTIEANDVLIWDGAVDAAGTYHVPHGLASWILNRNSPTYATDLATPFNGVSRSRAPSALGGQFYAATSGEKRFDAIMKGLRKARRAGGNPDLVIMNDIDAADAIAEYETLRTQFLGTDTKRANTFRGANSANFVLWSSVLDKLVDDPYCPQGVAYILEKDNFVIVHMDNLSKVIDQNGGTGEEPGRSDPLADDSANYGEDNQALMIEDIVSIEDGTRTGDGAAKTVAFNVFYEYALFNTAGSCVVDLSSI